MDIKKIPFFLPIFWRIFSSMKIRAFKAETEEKGSEKSVRDSIRSRDHNEH